MKNRIIATLGLAAAAVALSTTTANAATATPDVTKAQVQAALGWNNAAFDANVGNVAFTAHATKTFDNVLTCGANADNKVVHVPVTYEADVTVPSTKVLNEGNGKQVVGFNLDRSAVSVAGSNDLYKVMIATFTACLPDKPYTEMTPEELRRLPVKVETPTTATTTVGDVAISSTAPALATAKR